MIANYHTHTVRCKHASGTEREYIETAINNGFKILGFSDHVPQPYPEGFVSNIRMDMSELEDYTSTLVRLRDEYKDDIEIFIGYEVEYTKKYFEPLMEELVKYPLDYMILGQHFAPDEVDGFYVGEKTSDENRLKTYVDLTIEGMQTGLFTYLAHPDLINFIGEESIYQKHMERLIKAAITFDIPLEVNFYGFIDGRHYPNSKFWKLASAMKAKIVLGCDAHWADVLKQPEDIPGLKDFISQNNIICGDNILKLINPHHLD